MNPDLCFFVTDLHGKLSHYKKLSDHIRSRQPGLVLMGGDLLPHGFRREPGRHSAESFACEYLPSHFSRLRAQMGSEYPLILMIFGNDDPRYFETPLLEGEAAGLWQYLHFRKTEYRGHTVYGYAMVPPSPFKLKDWERYDVSRYVDPGCLAPEEGYFSVPPAVDLEYASIRQDLEQLCGDDDLSRAVFLFHSPPYKTMLDRAALDGMMVDHVPLDVHVGSIAIRRFIEERSPYLCLHGHIHESARITGSWRDSIPPTVMFGAAHDGPELSLIEFDLHDLESATRVLL